MLDIRSLAKLKDIAVNKTSTISKLIFVVGRVENIVGKREYSGYQHFLLFSTMFSKGFFSSVAERWD